MASDDINERFADAIELDVCLNRDSVTFPMALFHPESDGKATWIADTSRTDPSKITMVLAYDLRGPDEEKTISEVDRGTALETRRILVEAGWLLLRPPEVTISAPGGKRPLNRKEKRRLERTLAHLDKSNPFRSSE